jgi:hypothetical protein
MKTTNDFLKEIRKAALWTAGLTVLFVLFNLKNENTGKLLIALPFFVLLYFTLFSVGRTGIANRFREWLDNDIKKTVLFPAFFITVHFAYILLISQNPFKGSVSMIPYLMFFPALVFAARRHDVQKID